MLYVEARNRPFLYFYKQIRFKKSPNVKEKEVNIQVKQLGVDRFFLHAEEQTNIVVGSDALISVRSLPASQTNFLPLCSG
jgi:hypothetical protein